MASRATINALYNRVEQNKATSVSGKHFIQESKVREIFTPATIDLAVAELICDAPERLGLAKKIQQDGTIMFAILVSMGKADYIVSFRNYECLDRRLPVPEELAKEIAPAFGVSFARECQWQFLPYVFEQDMCDYHREICEVDRILPFVEPIENIGDGGFGEVTKLTIPTPLQHFFITKEDTVLVVRKKVKRRKTQTPEKNREAFEKEMSMLRLLRTLRHPNIVPLLGSYTYANEHNFLFPSFKMDLNDFLKQDARFGDFRWNFTFHLALCGLASALENTHGIRLKAKRHGLDFDAIGYHNDFRPANILVSTNTFILADFGLAELKPADASSAMPWRRGRGDYIAPECMDASFVPQEVDHAIDTWAFGCLVADVMTYMERGPEGVQKFRNSRLDDIMPNWQSTYFHYPNRKMKASVYDFLEGLGNNSSPPTKRLHQIALKALDPDPEHRPPISEIRSDLAVPSLEALLDAIVDIFDKYLVAAEEQRSLSMHLWVAGEQIRVFGSVFSPDDTNGKHYFKHYKSYMACCDAMMALFRRIESELYLGETESHSTLRTDRIYDRRGTFEEQIQGLVQNLWSLLPRNYERRAQAAWFQKMQRNDADRLHKIDTYLQSNRREELTDMTARAQMKKILLQMQNNPTAGAAEYFHPRKDLSDEDVIHGHTYGLFKSKQHVLVEFMYYRPELGTVSPEERLLIMQLRAKDFSIDPKPSGLRILKCLGFVEENDETDLDDGYAFLYELPQPVGKSFMPPATLRHLLQSEKEPSLRTKFQLAASLGLFFEEFYYAGCVHENFNSNNVIFVPDTSAPLEGNILWSQPYVVGFEKSRPDGQAWGTEGPADISKMQKYEQHPDYQRKGRFLLEYDYYSLGLVLLEIGGWTPLEILSAKKECRNMEPEDFRTFLRKKYVPMLAATVGEVYRDVVYACLDGALGRDRDDTSSDDMNRRVFREFVKKVSTPLEELSALRV